MNFADPWILLRLGAGAASLGLFARAGLIGLRVLRRFDATRSTEGQLLLERQSELAATYVRVGAIVQTAAALLTVLTADRLARSVRGAMCAYGVFLASDVGFAALGMSVVVAACTAVLAGLHAFDATVRSLELVRPLALGTVLVAPLVVVDVGMTAAFLLRLDLGVTASCCSTNLDAMSAALLAPMHGSPRIAAALAAAIVVTTATLAQVAARRPRPLLLVLTAVAASLAVAPAIAAIAFVVAPYVFEVPQHLCPFCLLHGDVFGIGYALFGALFAAFVSTVVPGAAALVARSNEARQALAHFAGPSLRRGAVLWAVTLALGIAPVVRYALLTPGASLLP